MARLTTRDLDARIDLHSATNGLVRGSIAFPHSSIIQGWMADVEMPNACLEIQLILSDETQIVIVAASQAGGSSNSEGSDGHFCFDFKTDPLRKNAAAFLKAAVPSPTFKIDLHISHSSGKNVVVPLLDHIRADFSSLIRAERSQEVATRHRNPSSENTTPQIYKPSHIKVVCFYLPQFHPIAENDEWWGPGFTEWSNVARTKSLFPKHSAPWLPADLGFYDLRLMETRRAQADLARQFSIDAFCYYFYWFQGRRLLQKPLELMLQDGEPSLPFCLCWANENWSRRWDGSENEILISQHHALESDTRLIEDMYDLLSHERYVRYKGKRLLLVYRPSLIPNRKILFKAWKDKAVALGLGEICICNVMTFGDKDPSSVDCDIAVEFPPHTVAASPINHVVEGLPHTFEGQIYDYDEVVANQVLSSYPFPYFPGVMPRWDNTPRKGHAGNIFHNASPAAFEIWLRSACNKALAQHGTDALVFVNSWNEWGEGAHIEPDNIVGRQYLEAVRRAKTRDPISLDALRGDLVKTLPRSELEASLRRQAIQLNIVAHSISHFTIQRQALSARLGSPDSFARPVDHHRGTLIIDSVNGSLSDAGFLAWMGDVITVRGWSFVDTSFVADQGRVALLRLINTGNRDVALVPLSEWTKRSDVSDSKGLQTRADFFGFQVTFETSQLEPGCYKFGISELTGEGRNDVDSSYLLRLM